MALKTAVAPCAPMREEKQPGDSPLDPVNSTAAAVYQFATPQRVRRTLPELSRSRGFKQAERFAFCPSGQKCPHAHAVSVSSCRLGLSPRLILQTTYRPREKPPGAFSLCSEELSASRPAAAGSAHLRRAREGTCPLCGQASAQTV